VREGRWGWKECPDGQKKCPCGAKESALTGRNFTILITKLNKIIHLLFERKEFDFEKF
jgi:hypothetical protein